MKRKERLTLLLLLIYLAAFAPTILAQSIQKEKMANLSFMVGEWVGNSTTYKEGSATTIPAYEKISYKVDSHLITIDLKSESLMLHTVIYYNEEEQTFYYCPFYKKGAGKYKGSFKDGKFLVKFNDEKKLTFQLTKEGYFQEYGEKLIDGKWEKYFEDILKPMPD